MIYFAVGAYLSSSVLGSASVLLQERVRLFHLTSCKNLSRPLCAYRLIRTTKTCGNVEPQHLSRVANFDLSYHLSHLQIDSILSSKVTSLERSKGSPAIVSST